MHDYLIHSAKGTTWSKKDHKYYKKVGNTYYYADPDAKKTKNKLGSVERRRLKVSATLGKLRNKLIRNFKVELQDWDTFYARTKTPKQKRRVSL